MPDAITIRPAVEADAAAITHIFNQGVEDRVATFETQATTPEAVAKMLSTAMLVLAAEREGDVIAFGRVTPYSDPHPYYTGVGEATLYVERGARRSGAGRTLMNALAAEAQDRGFYKLVGKIFTSNEPSIALVHACGWRDVGVHLRHGKLDGEWKDVLVVELLLGDAAT
jgi:L-amino acid N-acyltransferase YncA